MINKRRSPRIFNTRIKMGTKIKLSLSDSWHLVTRTHAKRWLIALDGLNKAFRPDQVRQYSNK